MLDCESRADQQVLQLESKEVPQSKRVNQALFASVGMRDVIHELEIADLIEAIVSDPLRVPADASAVRHLEFGFLRDFFAQRRVHESVKGRIEDIQNERSVIHQVAVNAVETRELVFHGQQV